MTQPTAMFLVDQLAYVAKYSDSEHWSTLAEAASELKRLYALNQELLTLAHQYANDMRYPPVADSRQRRLAAVEAVLEKVKS